jgi:hypothetical protein
VCTKATKRLAAKSNQHIRKLVGNCKAYVRTLYMFPQISCHLQVLHIRATSATEGQEGEYRYSTTLSLTSGCLVKVTPGRFTPDKDTRYPLYRNLGEPQYQTGRAWKISYPTGIRSPDRPARSESLYRLHSPGPQGGIWLNDTDVELNKTGDLSRTNYTETSYRIINQLTL